MNYTQASPIVRGSLTYQITETQHVLELCEELGMQICGKRFLPCGDGRGYIVIPLGIGGGMHNVGPVELEKDDYILVEWNQAARAGRMDTMSVHIVPDYTVGEKCSNCGKPASHKVAEEAPMIFDKPGQVVRHAFTTYLCCRCFTNLMGLSLEACGITLVEEDTVGYCSKCGAVQNGINVIHARYCDRKYKGR